MKNINFIKTGMENFCCYIDPMIYTFENDKITLITGPNGSGKSSIYDSILFSLFGVTGKGAKSDDVVNNVIGKNCHTYVEFTSETDGVIDNYRVDRYVKHSKLGDTVQLFKNGEKTPYKKGHKEVIPEIEKILVPQKLFTNTLLFGQKVKDFFTDLPDSERKDIFRKVLQLDNYVLYQDEASKRISKWNEELEKIDMNIKLNIKFIMDTEERIKITEEEIKDFELRKSEEINSLTQKINQLNTDLSKLMENQKNYENVNDLELNRINDKILESQNEISKIESEKNNLLTSLIGSKNLKESEMNSKYKEIIHSIELNKTTTISSLKKECDDKKSEEETNLKLNDRDINSYKDRISNNKINIEKNNQEILKLENSLNQSDPVCPTCGQILTNEEIKSHLKNNLKQLIEINKKLDEDITRDQGLIEESLSKKEKMADYIDKIKKVYDKKIIDIENDSKVKIDEINNNLSEAKNNLNNSFNEKKTNIENNFSDKLKTFSEKLNSFVLEKQKIVKDLEEKKIIERTIDNVNNDIKLNIILIEKKSEEKYNFSILENYISEKNRLQDERKILESEKLDKIEILEVLNFWKSGFSSTGIPSLLIDESIPFLNETVGNYLDMVGGRYKASFDTISTTKSGEYRDKINVNVLDTQTKANNRKQLSGGQTRIIDIAILLSLCDLQNTVQDMKSNILLLDEIFDSLDDQNIGYVSSLLRTMVNEKSINIISHRHIDSIEADEIIRLF